MTSITASSSAERSRIGPWIAGLLAIAFGLATLFEGGHVLFGGPAARAAAGNVVPFVLGFNFAAGFVYLLAGGAILARRTWAVRVAVALAATSLLVFAGLGVHILQGGAYEVRTVVAMTLRSGFWAAQALMLPRLLGGGRHV